MVVFGCAGCGGELTGGVSRVALPVHAHQRWGHELLPALMAAGTYAVDPEPGGPPWRPWQELAPGEAAAGGVYAPESALSLGQAGAVVVAPGDTRGTVFIPARLDGYCYGVDGRDGPNLACAQCGSEVGTRVDDCGSWQAVRFEAGAVRRLSGEEPVPAAGWDAMLGEGTPPVEQPGWWSPLWEAAAGVALAHVLALSEGRPVSARGRLGDYFGPVLEDLLPDSEEAGRTRELVLAGPGLGTVRPGALALVPRHPVTGETWRPPGGQPAVPLAAEVWTWLAFSRGTAVPTPVTGGLPAGVLLDYPLPRHPGLPFRPDRRVFLRTLARLPAVRRPWARACYDRVRKGWPGLRLC